MPRPLDVPLANHLVRDLCRWGRPANAVCVVEAYGPEATAATYGALVDGYCRVGLLEDARRVAWAECPRTCRPAARTPTTRSSTRSASAGGSRTPSWSSTACSAAGARPMWSTTTSCSRRRARGEDTGRP
uniref:Uncharacterized protein n=1 Tax=Zea mays TaxID=4577 RepID=A0A804PFS4_MAIZE